MPVVFVPPWTSNEDRTKVPTSFAFFPLTYLQRFPLSTLGRPSELPSQWTHRWISVAVTSHLPRQHAPRFEWCHATMYHVLRYAWTTMVAIAGRAPSGSLGVGKNWCIKAFGKFPEQSSILSSPTLSSSTQLHQHVYHHRSPRLQLLAPCPRFDRSRPLLADCASRQSTG